MTSVQECKTAEEVFEQKGLDPWGRGKGEKLDPSQKDFEEQILIVPTIEMRGNRVSNQCVVGLL